MSASREARLEPSSRKAAGHAFSAGGAQFALERFSEGDADCMLGWVKTPADLHRLAPKTSWPLTVEKIMGWSTPGCEAYVLRQASGRSAGVIGYGEVNWLPGARGQAWLGHIIVDPARRGRGLGCLLVQDLLEQAFYQRQAKSVCLIVFPDNKPAVECYRRVGFREVGEEKHRCSNRGTYEILSRFEMTRAEFDAAGLHLSG